MATRSPRWVGSKEIKLDPNFPEFVLSGQTARYVFVYAGPYLALRAAMPERGAVISGFPEYVVVEVRLKPSGAGMDGPGTLVITAEREEGGGGAGSEEDQTVVEIDAGALDKNLFTHPRFKNLSKAQISQIKKALDNNETVPGPTIPGPAEQAVQEIYDLLSRGQESYLVAAPIVRLVTTSVVKPTVGKIGVGTRTEDKPHSSAPAGYVWIKTADRATQTGRKGKWERVQEWSGADEWAEEIYGAQP